MKKAICWTIIVSLVSFAWPAASLGDSPLFLNPAPYSLASPGGQGVGVNQAVTPAVAAGDQSRTIAPGYVPQGELKDNYILGIGANLEVHVIVGDSALNLDYLFTINSEGKIFFPNIGEITLAGLTLKQAKKKLVSTIKKKYTEPFSLSIIIRSPGLVSIYVMGMVSNPGLLTIYDGTKISEAIKGVGISPGGSRRNLIVKRGKKEYQIVLYKISYSGKTEDDINIYAGDVITVLPIRNNRITVMGQVYSPGQYELLPGEGVKDALAMAGYVGANSALSSVVYLRRQHGQDNFENYRLNLYDLYLKGDNSQNVTLTDGDIISVPSINAYVYVYGEVGRAGRLDYQPGKKLSDYINLAGGPTVKANLGGVTITRQEKDKAKVYHINAANIILEGNLKYDIEIFGGDVVFVPANFFYFSDFASFANTILLVLTLYSTSLALRR